MKMKALTLTQPWATLVAIGAKKIETRSWNTAYRGLLAIHAAKGFPRWAKDICLTKPFFDVLREKELAGKGTGAGWIGDLPQGAVIATCELVHVYLIDELVSFPACGAFAWRKHIWQLNKQERSFGDYSKGRYMWLLENVVMLPEPIPAKGALGLWNWNQ
jgi:activating signal cointegrator 1